MRWWACSARRRGQPGKTQRRRRAAARPAASGESAKRRATCPWRGLSWCSASSTTAAQASRRSVGRLSGSSGIPGPASSTPGDRHLRGGGLVGATEHLCGGGVIGTAEHLRGGVHDQPDRRGADLGGRRGQRVLGEQDEGAGVAARGAPPRVTSLAAVAGAAVAVIGAVAGVGAFTGVGAAAGSWVGGREDGRDPDGGECRKQDGAVLCGQSAGEPEAAVGLPPRRERGLRRLVEHLRGGARPRDPGAEAVELARRRREGRVEQLGLCICRRDPGQRPGLAVADPPRTERVPDRGQPVESACRAALPERRVARHQPPLGDQRHRRRPPGHRPARPPSAHPRSRCGADGAKPRRWKSCRCRIATSARRGFPRRRSRSPRSTGGSSATCARAPRARPTSRSPCAASGCSPPSRTPPKAGEGSRPGEAPPLAPPPVIPDHRVSRRGVREGRARRGSLASRSPAPRLPVGVATGIAQPSSRERRGGGSVVKAWIGRVRRSYR